MIIYMFVYIYISLINMCLITANAILRMSFCLVVTLSFLFFSFFFSRNKSGQSIHYI
ncbi:MAG: hypothetical protein EXX96DRAFT_299203 [Benjaminiella poitrasii]|nr:MAG: hypothetical protein EXX96DRAFT_299203 [Benjaminiella poitrasii]